MWTITNSMNRLLGFKTPPVGAPVTPHKQGFHSFLPAAMTVCNYDKKFTNPNFVNPGNPSVLRSVQVSQSVTPSSGQAQTCPAVEPKGPTPVEHPPPRHLGDGAENSRAVVATEIGTKNSADRVKPAEGAPSPKTTAGMNGNTRKRSRRNRRGRRKQRDGHNVPGKHCKNSDKEVKHSKHVEQEQIIKEAMEIEQEVVRSPSEVAVDPLVESRCERYPKLFDYIQMVPHELHKAMEPSEVDYHNSKSLKQVDDVQADQDHQATYPDQIIVCFNIVQQPEHLNQRKLHDDDDDDGNCIDTCYQPNNHLRRLHVSQHEWDDDDAGSYIDTVFVEHNPELPRPNPSLYDSDDDDDDGNCVDTVFYGSPVPENDSSFTPQDNLGIVYRSQLIEDVPESNFKIHRTNGATQCSFDYSSEEESDDDGNCIDGVVCHVPLKLKPIQCEGKDEVDNVCFMGSSKRPIRVRQISVADSEDSFIVFDDGTDDECDFSEGGCEEEDEDENVVDLHNDVESEDESSDSETRSSCSVVPIKKVRFADDSNLCDVHPMVKWAYAYQAARKGPWEEYARDRERFKRRICETGRILNAVFMPTHRKHVFDERFAKFEGAPLKT